MISEFERLQQMYREMGDEHLRDLADAPEDLTGDARMALTAELRRRGWTPAPAPLAAPQAEFEPELQSGFGAAIPGVIPAGASAVEQALEPGGELRKGMVRLISFFDGHELTRACETLEDAGLDFAIEEVAGDAMSGLAPHFEVWVAPGGDAEARSLLRAKLGLFPLAEIDDSTDELTRGQDDEGAGDLVVAEFDSAAEAQSTQTLLLNEGFAARVEKVAGEGSLSSVVVPAVQQERALELLASRMGLE